MFEKSQKVINDPFARTNRIVDGTTITGDIVSQADFRLDGKLVGNFTSAGKIVIGPTGSVTGDIKCLNADIEGSYSGRIEVEELLTVKAKASITGEVITGKLAVEPGAEFTAACTMKNNVKPIAPVNEQQQAAG
ncbi:hypothetical protein AM493_14495 [Flavobacterium akiainvivens]|uniref:Cell shape determination protein CcmA n=1 Tax=Flavobacterium akiainvivens TaxID=1202724 RepID=A0A0M8MIV0_9FLAO|nr:polymer-forming cytoskeletal protein [Flavobacterium akiainvivens]KOS07111.1 hypothetical protein AM493_14495 [Flavobacterium akiainvivens]SFQ75735.1 protein CcmA, bactofilin family [Flavobacterium akiainvivens]